MLAPGRPGDKREASMSDCVSSLSGKFADFINGYTASQEGMQSKLLVLEGEVHTSKMESLQQRQELAALVGASKTNAMSVSTASNLLLELRTDLLALKERSPPSSEDAVSSTGLAIASIRTELDALRAASRNVRSDVDMLKGRCDSSFLCAKDELAELRAQSSSSARQLVRLPSQPPATQSHVPYQCWMEGSPGTTSPRMPVAAAVSASCPSQTHRSNSLPVVALPLTGSMQQLRVEPPLSGGGAMPMTAPAVPVDVVPTGPAPHSAARSYSHGTESPGPALVASQKAMDQSLSGGWVSGAATPLAPPPPSMDDHLAQINRCINSIRRPLSPQRDVRERRERSCDGRCAAGSIGSVATSSMLAGSIDCMYGEVGPMSAAASAARHRLTKLELKRVTEDQQTRASMQELPPMHGGRSSRGLSLVVTPRSPMTPSTSTPSCGMHSQSGGGHTPRVPPSNSVVKIMFQDQPFPAGAQSPMSPPPTAQTSQQPGQTRPWPKPLRRQC